MASKRALALWPVLGALALAPALALWPLRGALALALALDDYDDNHPGYPIPPAHRTQEKNTA